MKDEPVSLNAKASNDTGSYIIGMIYLRTNIVAVWFRCPR